MWVIKITTSYTNGFTSISYFKGYFMGFLEFSNLENAKIFKTKKEAVYASQVIRTGKSKSIEIEKW